MHLCAGRCAPIFAQRCIALAAPERGVISIKKLGIKMSGNETLIICALLATLGIIVISGVIWFGFIVTKQPKSKGIFPHPIFEEILHYWGKNGPRYSEDIPRLTHDAYTEYLQRRNEFWTAYGQVLLAILIVIVLGILLVTKTISAEAGLPILSAISGFAIAKGISTGRSGMSPPPRRPNDG